MAKLFFYYSAMNAGKSTTLLQSSYNYRERGMSTLLLTPQLDNRFGDDTITSRIGLDAEATARLAGLTELTLGSNPIGRNFSSLSLAEFVRSERRPVPRKRRASKVQERPMIWCDFRYRCIHGCSRPQGRTRCRRVECKDPLRHMPHATRWTALPAGAQNCIGHLR